MESGRFRLYGVVALLASPILFAGERAADDRLLSQREAFRQAYERAELGDWRVARDNDALLRDYVLWPDLRAAWLKTRIRNADYDGVDEFLDAAGTLKPARELRYFYALHLGKKDRHQAYLKLYDTYYAELGIARLDCLALRAQLASGSAQAEDGLSVWLVPGNQVEECDPVFDALRKSGVIGEAQYQERFELAVEAREFAIARYLARSLDGDYQQRAKHWSAANADPEQFIAQHDPTDESAEYRDQLAYAVEKLAYRQPGSAARNWREIRPHYAFSNDTAARLDRHVALWSARRHEPEAISLLSAVPDESRDTEVHRWLARAALKSGDWHTVTSAIAGLPDEEKQRDEWRYWAAFAAEMTDGKDAARDQLTLLAGERSYYGFLAADRVGASYQLEAVPATPDTELINDLERRAPILRARELFLVGLESRGRSEWDSAVALLSAEEKIQAALMASSWGWHSRAISTVALVNAWDDLELRYPLPYHETFEEHAERVNINSSWAFGVARSESLFMRDVRSGAGAVGLMQLMPETGRLTARELGVPWSGTVTLTDPDSNIRLGTAYLRKMLDRFRDHRVLATAAYNAGPLNVESWLPADGALDAAIWIANIPYNETRGYVTRVLATESIFEWRINGNTRRVSEALVEPVRAPGQNTAAVVD